MNLSTQSSMQDDNELRRRKVLRGREQAAGESLLQPGDATSYRQPRVYSVEERERMATYESVDAFEPHNSIYLDHLQFRYSEPRWFIWVFSMVVGVLSGFTGVIFVSLMHVIINMKYYLLDYAIRGFPTMTSAEHRNVTVDMFSGQQLPMQGAPERNVWYGYWVWLAFSLTCSILSAVLLKIFPEARGVGSPEVLAYLNGVNNHQMVDKKAFLARFVISLLSIGSGNCTGYFGTLVQSGVMIAKFVTERSRVIQFPNVNVVRCFRNPKDRRNIAIIGAAAGVGSAFSVTIGGLMYVIEQVAQRIPVKVAFYTFSSCLVSSFTLQVYFSYMNSFSTRDRSGFFPGDLLTDVLIIFDTKLFRTNLIYMNIFDIIPTIFIGAICGGLSVLYVRISWISLRFRRRLQNRFFSDFKYIEPVIITAIYVTLTYWISVGWGSTVEPDGTPSTACSIFPEAFDTKRRESVVGYYGMISSLCEQGPLANSSSGSSDPFGPSTENLPVVHNFASLAMSPSDSALQFLLTWSTSDYLQPATLSVFTLIYFFFTAATSGIAMGGDILLPALVIGAAVGRLCGQITQHAATSISPDTQIWADPAVFALIGAGSFMGGVTGMTFSACIILMEMTGDNRHIICIMIGISIAKMIADRYCHSITTSHLEAKCVPILDFESRIHKYDMFCARNIMQAPVLTFTSMMDAKSIIETLETTAHNGFPVVSFSDRSFKGMVLRSHLEIILWNLHWTRKGDPCTYARIREIEDRRFSEKILGLPPLSKKLLRTQIDLLPYVDFSAYAVHEATSLSRTYHMFRTLGLRHLVVVNRSNQVVGMITRKDLVSDRMMERIQEENEKRRAHLGYGPSDSQPAPVDTASDLNDALSFYLMNRKTDPRASHSDTTPLLASRKLPKLSDLVIDDEEDQEYTIIGIANRGSLSDGASVNVPITPQSQTGAERYFTKNLLIDVDPQAVDGFFVEASRKRLNTSEPRAKQEAHVSSPIGHMPAGSYMPPTLGLGIQENQYAKPREAPETYQNLTVPSTLPPQARLSSAPAPQNTEQTQSQTDSVSSSPKLPRPIVAKASGPSPAQTNATQPRPTGTYEVASPIAASPSSAKNSEKGSQSPVGSISETL